MAGREEQRGGSSRATTPRKGQSVPVILAATPLGSVFLSSALHYCEDHRTFQVRLPSGALCIRQENQIAGGSIFEMGSEKKAARERAASEMEKKGILVGKRGLLGNFKVAWARLRFASGRYGGHPSKKQL